MLKSTFHQCLGSGMAILLQKALIQAAAVDTDADRDLTVLADVNNSLDPIFPADVAGVDTDLCGAAFCGGDRQLIVEMDIRHQGQSALSTDISEAFGRFHIGHGEAGDLASGSSQLSDLLQGACHIRGLRIEHGLDHHRGAATDGDTTNNDLSGHGITPLPKR